MASHTTSFFIAVSLQGPVSCLAIISKNRSEVCKRGMEFNLVACTPQTVWLCETIVVLYYMVDFNVRTCCSLCTLCVVCSVLVSFNVCCA